MLKDHVFQDLLVQLRTWLKDRSPEDLKAAINKWSAQLPQNALLIEMQRPGATEVKSWFEWSTEGRDVHHGERSIKTLRLDGDAEYKEMRGGRVRMRQYFEIVHLFDVNQTHQR